MSSQGARRGSSGSPLANGRESRAPSKFPGRYAEGERRYRTDQSESRYRDIDTSLVQDYCSTQHSIASDVPRASIERSPSPSSAAAYREHYTRGNDAQAGESRRYHEKTPFSPGFQRDHRRSTRSTRVEPRARQARPGAQTSHFQVYDDESNEESRRRRSDAPPRDLEPLPRALGERQDRNGPYGAENSSEHTLSPGDQPRNRRESSGDPGTSFSDW